MVLLLNQPKIVMWHKNWCWCGRQDLVPKWLFLSKKDRISEMTNYENPYAKIERLGIEVKIWNKGWEWTK